MTKKEYDKIYNEQNRERIKERNKRYQEKNKDRIKEKKIEYQLTNRQLLNEKAKQYRLDNKEKISLKRKENRLKNIEKVKAEGKKYYETNKKIIRERNKIYSNKRLSNDPLFKMSKNIRSLIYGKIKRNGYSKQSKTYQILGCTYQEFKIYLETKFEDWMNWDNYGKYEKDKFNVGWDIDHVIPLAESKTEEEIIKLNHYTNLQPLCSKTNRDVKKGKL